MKATTLGSRHGTGALTKACSGDTRNLMHTRRTNTYSCAGGRPSLSIGCTIELTCDAHRDRGTDSDSATRTRWTVRWTQTTKVHSLETAGRTAAELATHEIKHVLLRGNGRFLFGAGTRVTQTGTRHLDGISTGCHDTAQAPTALRAARAGHV